MSDDQKPAEQPQLPAIMILKQIQEGIIDKKTLPKEMRQTCVEYLLTQFQSISKIAGLLGRDERTIKRDKKEIEQRNAQKPSVDLALELIAELMRKANAIQEQLMELAKDKEGSVQEKSQAAFYLWKAIQEQMQLLQRLGYLPEQPLKVEANVTQESGRDASQLIAELAEAEKIATASGRIHEPAIAGLIKAIKQEIAIAEANNSLDELKKLIAGPDNVEGKQNEINNE